MKIGQTRVTEKEAKEMAAMYGILPNVAEVCRKSGRSCNTVLSALKSQGINPSRKRNIPAELKSVDNVVADNIIKRIEKDPDMFSANFEKLSRILGSSNVIGVMRHPEKYKDTVVQQARTGLLMGLSYLITEDKLKEASPSAIAQVIPILAEIASGKYSLGAGIKQEINSEEIMMSIKVALKKIKTFNPVLAKETEDTIQHLDAIDTEAFAVKDKKENK